MTGHAKIPRIVLVIGAALCAYSPRAHAFDWEGRLQRELKGLSSPSAMTRRWAIQRLGSFPAKQVKGYVLKALRDTAPMVRLTAAEVAARLHIAEATPALMRWLSHWDDKLREAAAQHLPAIAGPAVAPALLRSLVDPEPKVRQHVVKALGKLRYRDSVLPLIARLDDANVKVRSAAIGVLAMLRDQRAVIPLMARLADTSSQVREAAVTALGAFGDQRTAPSIARLLRDPAQQVVGAAIETLGKLRYAGAVEPLIEVFQHRDTYYREAAARALATIGTELALNTLVRALSRPTLRSAAQSALSSATRQTPQYLGRLLVDPRTPRHVALIAVQIARNARLKGAVPPLIEQLRLGRLPRILLVEALGQIADPRAQRPLLGLLGDRDHELRLAALNALKDVLDARAAEPLMRCLDDPSPEVRLTTIHYLGRLGARVATQRLTEIVDRSPQESYAALAALAEIADPRAFPTFLTRLASSDLSSRRLAVVALGRITCSPSQVGQIVALCRRRGGAVRASCIQGLGAALRGRSDAAARAFLARAVSIDDSETVSAALDAFSALADPSAAGLLLRRLEHTTSPALRARIIEALGAQVLSARVVVPRLTQALDAEDPLLSSAAAWALTKLPLPAATTAALAKATASRHWATRVNATAALAMARAPAALPLLRQLALDRNPHVRANALVGLTRLGDRASTSTMLGLVQRDQSPWVRINALRFLLRYTHGTLRVSGEAHYMSARALAREVVRSDADPRARRLAKQLLERSPGVAGHHWVQAYLRDHRGQHLREQDYLLILPNGLVKAARSGARALLWEERIPAGKIFLELPAPGMTQEPKPAPPT